MQKERIAPASQALTLNSRSAGFPQFFRDVKKHHHTKLAQSDKQAAVTTATPTAAHSGYKYHGPLTSTNTIGSVFVLQSNPMCGLWFGKASPAIDLRHRWHLRGGSIAWEPFTPANAHKWDERIHALAEKADERRRTGAFLRLGRTSQTRTTWSLPAIASCPMQDEACEYCYACKGRYPTGLAQVDRVLRLEYLKRLIGQDGLATWIDWMVDALIALPPDEPLPPALRGQGLPDAWNRGDGVQYMRWHDSGDMFHEEYALAIIKVCEATPGVAHWLPTRMGRLICSLVERGVTIPPNLSIMVSAQRAGKFEQAQVQAVRDVLKVQPSARIGLSYFVNGPVRRIVDMHFVEEQFGHRAVVCQALTLKKREDRVCAGCRRCWVADIAYPVIYPRS